MLSCYKEVGIMRDILKFLYADFISLFQWQNLNRKLKIATSN